MKNKIITSGSADLFTCSQGNGTPVIVIHGGSGLSHDYLLELLPLSEHHQLIFYDQQACGRSSGQDINMPTFVKDLECIRKAYDHQTVTLFGHSWGGLLAMRYAIEHPSKVSRLILLNSLGASYTPQPRNPYMEGIQRIKNSEGFKNRNLDAITQSYKQFFQPFFHQPQHAENLNLGFTLQSAINSIDVREKLEENFFQKSYNYENELRKLQIPTLIIHGESDLIPRFVPEQLNRLIPNSKAIYLKECGHFPHLEQPTNLFNAILESD